MMRLTGLAAMILAMPLTPLALSASASTAQVVAAGSSGPITLTAADKVKVRGIFYAASIPRAKATILLFHQAGSNKAEYATIAPQLAKAGYTVLAIDQRSGGSNFGGRNETVMALGKSTGFLAAEPDLAAALEWAARGDRPVIIWGSSYSAALVFRLAAANPGRVAAIMAFSPGEYLGGKTLVRTAATKVHVPVFVTSAKDAGEVAAARAILAASPAKLKRQFVPSKAGVHGSSTLIAARNPAGAAENWAAVLAFLDTVTR